MNFMHMKPPLKEFARKFLIYTPYLFPFPIDAASSPAPKDPDPTNNLLKSSLALRLQTLVVPLVEELAREGRLALGRSSPVTSAALAPVGNGAARGGSARRACGRAAGGAGAEGGAGASDTAVAAGGAGAGGAGGRGYRGVAGSSGGEDAGNAGPGWLLVEVLVVDESLASSREGSGNPGVLVRKSPDSACRSKSVFLICGNVCGGQGTYIPIQPGTSRHEPTTLA